MNISDAETRSLLHIAGSFYDAAAQTAPWSEALESLANLYDITGTIFEQHDRVNDNLLQFESNGLPEQALADWAEYYHALCPRLAYLKHHPVGTVGFDYKVIDKYAMRHHPVYQEFLKPYGTQYFLSATLEQDGERYTTLSMQRTFEQGHVNDRDIALLKLLVPQMQRALKLKKRLGLAHQCLSNYQAAFHALRTGVVILNTQGKVEFINQSAESTLMASQELSIKSGQVSFANNQAQRSYSKALADLSKTAISVTAGSNNNNGNTYYCISPQMPGCQPNPIRVDILPLPEQARFSTALMADQSPGKRLLLMICDLRRPAEPADKILRACFHLTPMETRLALALAEGIKLKDYADRQGVTINTVRTHLVSLRHKMGARSQADVVRLVLQFTSPML